MLSVKMTAPLDGTVEVARPGTFWPEVEKLRSPEKSVDSLPPSAVPRSRMSTVRAGGVLRSDIVPPELRLLFTTENGPSPMISSASPTATWTVLCSTRTAGSPAGTAGAVSTRSAQWPAGPLSARTGGEQVA